MNEEKYIKGFNNGYELQQNNPTLFEKLINGIQGENDYKTAMQDGGNQYEAERLQQQLRNTRSKGRTM